MAGELLLLLACTQRIEMGETPKGDDTATDAPDDTSRDTAGDTSRDTAGDTSRDTAGDTSDTGDAPLTPGDWITSPHGNPLLVGQQVTDVYTFDLDGDGIEELVLTDTDLTDDFDTGDDAWAVGVACWMGDRTWSDPDWALLDHREDITLAIDAADLDGDGLSELVVTHADGYSVFPGRSCGHLGPRRDVATDAIQAFTLADFDGDGRADLLGYVPDTGETQLLTGDGAGGFTLVTSTIGLNSRRMTAGLRADLDGDGSPELITRKVDDLDSREVWFSVAWVEGGEVHVDDSFLAPLGQEDLWSFAAVRTEGGPRLAYNHYYAPDVPLLDWTGRAWATAGQLAGADATVVAAGDHDGDGWDDVYVLDWADELSVWRHADGYTTPEIRTIEAVTQPWGHALDAGDLDDDGDEDVVITGSGYLEVVLGG